MDKIVVIFIIIAALIAWISYLIYSYNLSSSNLIAYKKKYNDAISKYINTRRAIDSFIETLNKKFPGSSLYYIDEDETQAIKGELKINTKQ